MFDSIWVIIISMLMFFWINGCIHTDETLLTNIFDITIFADIAFSVVIILLIYGGLKWYCELWRKITEESNLLWIYERIYIPCVIVSTPFIYKYYGRVSVDNISIIDMVLAVGLLVMLSDPYGYVRKYIKERRFFNVYESSESFLFLSFPPKHRIDILPIDILYNLLIFIPMFLFR